MRLDLFRDSSVEITSKELILGTHLLYFFVNEVHKASGTGLPETFSHTTSNVGWIDTQWVAELYQVHEPVHPKEIQSQQRIRNKILFGKPQACKNMIRCGLFCSTFWEISKLLELSEEIRLLIRPLRKRVRVVWLRLLQSIDRQPPGREP
ncbi:hypothetical protein AVEN_84184-1 [Araneus ventricosus]|uniref:Uncharacterized protein n=1 Tax=Araneus ventricosus TaxID=182803 RepID=A0A4Y2SE61_ARAVE|nr:hypothetical protein AVEN_84184-1 [Araneus ventricosus]